MPPDPTCLPLHSKRNKIKFKRKTEKEKKEREKKKESETFENKYSLVLILKFSVQKNHQSESTGTAASPVFPVFERLRQDNHCQLGHIVPN